MNRNTIYTAAIIHTDDLAASPWISSFSTREARDTYIAEAKALIAEHDLADRVIVAGYSSSIDDTSYLGALW